MPPYTSVIPLSMPPWCNGNTSPCQGDAPSSILGGGSPVRVLCPWCSGNTSAFQAEVEGSIPSGHSKRCGLVAHPPETTGFSFLSSVVAPTPKDGAAPLPCRHGLARSMTPPSQGGERRFESGWRYECSDGCFQGWRNNPYCYGWGVTHITVQKSTSTPNVAGRSAGRLGEPIGAQQG